MHWASQRLSLMDFWAREILKHLSKFEIYALLFVHCKIFYLKYRLFARYTPLIMLSIFLILNLQSSFRMSYLHTWIFTVETDYFSCLLQSSRDLVLQKWLLAKVHLCVNFLKSHPKKTTGLLKNFKWSLNYYFCLLVHSIIH